MRNSFDEQFYSKFNFGLHEINYFNSRQPVELASVLAQQIVEKLQPKQVLDFGCAAGYLVDELRKRGVEAFGIDVSDFAISKVRDRIASFCFLGSIFDELPKHLPQKFDLVVCCGVFDFLKPYDFKIAINKLCLLSENVLLGSYILCANSFEQNYLNSLADVFAQKGMFKDGFYFFKNESCYLTLFSKHIESFDAVLAYEQNIFRLNEKILKLNKENEKLNAKVLQYAADLVTYKEIGERYTDLQQERENFLIELNVLRASYERYRAVTESRFWKLTQPFRFFIDFVKKCVRTGLRLVVYGRCKGVVYDGQKVSDAVYYFKKTQPTERLLQWQRETKFKKNYLISIVVPVYNVSINFLQELICSVNSQTYKFWELCIADGSDAFSFKIRNMCEEQARQNPRIKYLKLDQNLGIAQNTNAALGMATGDYVALLDHDDLLSPTALFECMKAVEKHGADFVYTDELTFENSLHNVKFIHFKPDFSPDTLRSNNYICHLSLFSMKLVKEVGGFSSNLDGSQDYDMILKLVEKAKKVVHVPKVLYYWREHSASVAQNLMNKPYCLEAAKKALALHLKRLGLKGEVFDSRYPSTYRIDYALKVKSKISIIVVNKNSVASLKRCIDSVVNGSSYSNFELVIVGCGSNVQTCDYYEVLKQRDSRVKVVLFNDFGDFNYSRAVNFGVLNATGDFLVLLHSDTKIVTADWLERMLMFAQRDDVGAVGAKLLCFDDTIQGGGYFLSKKHVALNAFSSLMRHEGGYVCRASLVQNMSAVSSVCMMIRRSVWQELGGFNESLALNFSDVDFCLKLRRQGLLVVYNAYVEIYHSQLHSTFQNVSRAQRRVQYENEKSYMLSTWQEVLNRADPYYNPNLDDSFCDFSIKPVKAKILEFVDDED